MFAQLEIDRNTPNHGIQQGYNETFDKRDMAQGELFALTPTWLNITIRTV